MKKLSVYEWIAVIIGGLIFLLYLFYVIYAFQHFQSADAFVLRDQSDMAWMDALMHESQLLLRVKWIYPYLCGIALMMLLFTKRYWFLALYGGLTVVAFAAGVLLCHGAYWGNLFEPLLEMRKVVIVIALYFLARLIVVVRKEKQSVPDRTTVFARRIHEERVARKLTQEDVAEKLHMSRSTVSRLETGVTPPVEETIAAFGALYEIPESELTSVPIPPGEEDERAFAVFGLLISLGYSLAGFGAPLVFSGVLYSAYRRFSKPLIIFGVVVFLLSLVMLRFFLPLFA